jgi:acyl-CoA synthetase (AMP-forming)/AMP-acid ligase II
MDKWTPEEMLRLIDTHRCTHTHMVPTQFHRLLALPEEVRARYDVSSMRHAIHGAAPCPDHVKRAMLDWWGPCVEEYYAASEGGGAFATAEAWPISELAIFDDDGNRLPSGELGTVYLKMNTGGFAYHKDEAKTKKNRIGDFFTVGDLGLLDEDGYLFLRDRKIDMIISGGVNIYPAEIESVLLQHPAVADAAAFGIPHDDWGEEVKAVVEPAPGHPPGPATSSPTAPPNSPATSARRASTSSPRCPGIPTASCTSDGCGSRTGRGARDRCEPQECTRTILRPGDDMMSFSQNRDVTHRSAENNRVWSLECGVRVRGLGVRQQSPGHRAAAAVPAHRLDVAGPRGRC